MPESNELNELSQAEEIEQLKNALKEKETSSDLKVKKKFSIKTTPKWLLVLVAVAVVMGLAFFTVRVIQPWIATMQAEKILNETTSEIASIEAINNEMIPWTPDAAAVGEIPEGVNPKQLALGIDGVASEEAVFTFSSEKANKDSHVVDIYMDFYSQRSRDFITINKTTLESMLSSGKIILNVHPVLNQEPFSIHAPEALAEAFGVAPDKAWRFFTDLLKESITLEGNETADDVVAFIANNAEENIGCKPEGFEDSEYCAIDEASIVNATFLTWLYTSVDSPRLNVGYMPPVLYIDDKELDQNIWTINDPDMMFKFFSELK